MTPQEASEELKEEFEIFKSGIDPADWDNPSEELKRIIEANTMAIKALEQQPCEDPLDKIITQIEQVRDKDKLCEYPYNRCIRIIEEHRTGNSPVSVPAPKRKAAINRQVIVTWFTPEEKLPEEDICVLATVTATAGNKRFIRTVLPVFYCISEGWYELDYGFSELTVHAWCDLDPYEGG